MPVAFGEQTHGRSYRLSSGFCDEYEGVVPLKKGADCLWRKPFHTEAVFLYPEERTHISLVSHSDGHGVRIIVGVISVLLRRSEPPS